MMTREDMLRELDLLPVWQLRIPLSQKVNASPSELQTRERAVDSQPALVSEMQLEIDEVESEHVVVNLGPDTSSDLTLASNAQSSLPLARVISEDGDWLFVMPNIELPADEVLLFENICKAIRVKAKPASIAENSTDILSGIKPRVLIVMGEASVQAMLQTNATLDNLRGRLHSLQDLPVVATYDLAHLVRHAADKANAWQDLCLALHLLHN